MTLVLLFYVGSSCMSCKFQWVSMWRLIVVSFWDTVGGLVIVTNYRETYPMEPTWCSDLYWCRLRRWPLLVIRWYLFSSAFSLKEVTLGYSCHCDESSSGVPILVISPEVSRDEYWLTPSQGVYKTCEEKEISLVTVSTRLYKTRVRAFFDPSVAPFDPSPPVWTS